MLTDCYEKGHTPVSGIRVPTSCAKCGEPVVRVWIQGAGIWHTQAELDRLWQGVDREASRVLGEGE